MPHSIGIKGRSLLCSLLSMALLPLSSVAQLKPCISDPKYIYPQEHWTQTQFFERVKAAGFDCSSAPQLAAFAEEYLGRLQAASRTAD